MGRRIFTSNEADEDFRNELWLSLQGQSRLEFESPKMALKAVAITDRPPYVMIAYRLDM